MQFAVGVVFGIQSRYLSFAESLDEVGPMDENSFPIMVSDDDGESLEFDMADIDEFDPIVDANHFFSNSNIELIRSLNKYIKKETALY